MPSECSAFVSRRYALLKIWFSQYNAKLSVQGTDEGYEEEERINNEDTEEEDLYQRLNDAASRALAENRSTVWIPWIFEHTLWFVCTRLQPNIARNAA